MTSRESMMLFLDRAVNKLVNLHVSGAENIPDKGGFLLTTSHISRLDTPLLMLSTQRQDVIGMVAKDYQRKAFFGWFLEKLQVIWINRDGFDFDAFRRAINYLKGGGIVGLAPEGTRSRDKTLMEGKLGAALIAKKADVPLIPASIRGSSEMWQAFSHFRKMDVEISFGSPYSLPEQKEGDDLQSWLKTATDEIMCRIAALLPPEMWGAYAGHSRLLQLLQLQPALETGESA